MNVRVVTFEYRKEPVSVWIAVNRFVAIAGVSVAPSSVRSSYTISPVAAADTSIQFTCPYRRLSG